MDKLYQKKGKKIKMAGFCQAVINNEKKIAGFLSGSNPEEIQIRAKYLKLKTYGEIFKR